MTPTITQIIRIAKISQYLFSVDILRGGLYAAGADLQLPEKIKNVREDVEYWYNLSPSDTTLSATSKYLYALCGKYALAAQAVTGGGGSVAPISPINQYQYTVLPITITVGGATYQNNQLVGGKDLGFVILNNQNLTEEGGDFTVNYDNGVISFITVTLFIGDKLTLPFNKKI